MRRMAYSIKYKIIRWFNIIWLAVAVVGAYARATFLPSVFGCCCRLFVGTPDTFATFATAPHAYKYIAAGPPHFH